jgi:hypothetical protein
MRSTSRRRPAKKKSHDAMFFVNTARFGVREARPPGIAWQDAMRSTSRRRPAKKKSHDAMFFVNTARYGVREARPR